ncbi:uncharacterized protein GLRG_11950 [Colletotrichum graminicola M1.001]|uniref:Lysine-specific metallo-endopeptidase domain-containing protein n=1 Tax=Colletotrichum graminicola (strain M1.001 / M2 / FGSC 10212) TaxID=645133 RepID=E3R116_COLGM|nr:uncharacterized protein GLRG_11950 [Colletotrichum graminicola M1.001]EFQ36804.1 hypothetical protein GLRG_11950 [Colletotrichum graminicola M1.001]
MQSITEAKQLADAASKVLRVKGVETSRAFYTWFGSSNANPQFVNTLLDQHYTTAYTHLVPPAIPVTLLTKGRAQFVVGKGDPPPGINSLLYLCPPPGGLFSELCEEDGMASVTTVKLRNGERAGPTILAACPTFFHNSIYTNDKMVASYRQSIDIAEYSRGFYLLHELQHMPKATSPEPPAIDVDNPRSKGKCYGIRCCALLPHNQKIKNAQNYAFFALDAIAYPELSAPGSA